MTYMFTLQYIHLDSVPIAVIRRHLFQPPRPWTKTQNCVSEFNKYINCTIPTRPLKYMLPFSLFLFNLSSSPFISWFALDTWLQITTTLFWLRIGYLYGCYINIFTWHNCIYWQFISVRIYLLCDGLHDGCRLWLQLVANAPKCPTCRCFQSERPSMMPGLLDISPCLVVLVNHVSLQNYLPRCRVVWQEPPR